MLFLIFAQSGLRPTNGRCHNPSETPSDQMVARDYWVNFDIGQVRHNFHQPLRVEIVQAAKDDLNGRTHRRKIAEGRLGFERVLQ
jgi:hypothetical protein